MADAAFLSGPGTFKGAPRRISVEEKRAPSGGRRKISGGGSRATSADYNKPIIKSAARRWKRLHEQRVMERLLVMRAEKKEVVKHSRDDAKLLARRIPTEMLAKEWLNDNQATLEMRAYMVDKLLPTLILGVEKLLNEADKRNLTENGDADPNFNPINFLAQYLMRNNPKYSNFSEASPYVRGMREVAEDLRKYLFNIDDNRLARIKADAKRKRDDREQREKQRQEEKLRRENTIKEQFKNWINKPEDRVELFVLQGALRSFIEVAEKRFPPELYEAAQISFSDETEESGRTLAADDFAEYIVSQVDSMPTEIFEQFMVHLDKCADAYRAATQRESRRIILTNLFISCDHSGIGILDRHRILNLFEKFYDEASATVKKTLRNPRKWPVVEVDEADDSISDNEEEDMQTAWTEQDQIQTFSDTKQEKLESDVQDKNDDTTENDIQQSESHRDKEDNTETNEDNQEKTSKDSEENSDQTKEEFDEKMDDQKPVEDSDVKDESNAPPTDDKPEVDSGPEKSVVETEDKEVTTNDKENVDVKSEIENSDEKDAKPEGINADGPVQEEKTDETDKEKEAQNVSEKDQDESDVNREDKSSSKSEENKLSETNASGKEISVTFAEGITFEREKTGMTSNSMSRSHSQLSAFDENTLNVSQFVQVTETFLGDNPDKPAFTDLVKYLKDGYEETEDEKMQRLLKARQDAMTSRRKLVLDKLFEKWDNDGSGFLELEEVENVLQKYKEGQEIEAIDKGKRELRRKSKHHDHRLSRKEFRNFIGYVVNEIPGSDAFDSIVEFLMNNVERTYAERVRGEARKKWLQQILNSAESSGARLEPVYKAVFQALYKDAEAHGGGKKISASISMLESNNEEPNRGDMLLRYVATTPEDAEYMLGKCLFQDMKGISFSAVQSGKPVHVPRVVNHGGIMFWNTTRHQNEKDGSFIVVPLKDKRKRVFGILGVDTLVDPHKKAIFITHEIQFFQGVAKSFSIAYHYVDMRKKLLRITESAVSWIHRRSPHVNEVLVYMVEPDGKAEDYILRKMMSTDGKGNAVTQTTPPRLDRKDNLFRDYLFKCVDNSETVTADAYGERHLAFPLRDDQGRTVAVLDICIGSSKKLPAHENKEVQRMLRLLTRAHKEITQELEGDDVTTVLEVERNEDTRLDVMFDRLMLMELRENVMKLDTKSYAELKSYIDPPKVVHSIMKATLAIFYPEEVESGEFDDWTVVKSHINSDLSQKISEFDPTSSDKLIAPEKVELHLSDVPHGDVIKHASLPAQYLYNWVFVCLSLIEHTLKMRVNAKTDAVSSDHDDTETIVS